MTTMLSKIEIQLLEDVHGFPTFAVSYNKVRYNFCHLSDVSAFIFKLYDVDNDVLLKKQVPRRSAKKVVTKVKYETRSHLANLVLSLCDNPINVKEVVDYVQLQYPDAPRKKIENVVTSLHTRGKLQRVSYGCYQKVCVDGTPRELHNVG